MVVGGRERWEEGRSSRGGAGWGGFSGGEGPSGDAAEAAPQGDTGRAGGSVGRLPGMTIAKEDCRDEAVSAGCRLGSSRTVPAARGRRRPWRPLGGRSASVLRRLGRRRRRAPHHAAAMMCTRSAPRVGQRKRRMPCTL